MDKGIETDEGVIGAAMYLVKEHRKDMAILD